MEIFWAVVILILSFLLLVWGGDKFVDASIGVAKKLKIPAVVVGATITSIGTTLPELLVTIFSGASNSASLALGNAMGSIIFNSCLIGGILLICFTLKGSNSKTPSLLLIFSATFLCVTAINKKLDLWECIILLILFVIFFVLNLVYEKSKESKIKQLQATKVQAYNSNQENSFVNYSAPPSNIAEKEFVTAPPIDASYIEELDPSPVNLADKNLTYYLLKFLISAAAIGVGAYFLVEKAKFLAGAIGISDTIIGLTVVGFGTSLPELITTISAIRKKEAFLGLGNIIGSNIINCTLLTSLASILNGSALIFDTQSLLIGIPVCLICTLLLLLPTIIKKTTYKWQGFALIGVYVVYFCLLLASSLV